MIEIEFNGQPRRLEQELTLLQLLEQSGVESRFCAVEINLEILPKPEYATYRVKAGDKIEVVTLVGGG